MNLHGVFPPLTTPFNADESLALLPLRSNIARYNATGLRGYIVLGSTGEAVMLTREESDRVLAVGRDAAAEGKILIAGTGAESTAETIQRTNRAAELGYDAALVKTPHYYKPQMDGEAEAEHFLRVAETARIPILIYSVPQFTGIPVEAGLAARLATHPNIVGIKESSGEVRRAAEIVGATPGSFLTLVGSATTFFDSLSAGAVGGILAIACVFPELCVELYEASRAGNGPRAQALQQCLLGPSQVIVSRLGVPGIKYALEQVGYHGGPARRPLRPLDENSRRQVEAAVASVASLTTAKP